MRPPLQAFGAIVVAAGQGSRAGQTVPKQFASYQGKPLIRHSVEHLRRAGAVRIVVAIPAGGQGRAAESLAGITNVEFVIGGETRQQSVRIALESIETAGVERVLIHDAARPYVPVDVVARIIAALNDHPGAIPVLPVVDSLISIGETLENTAPDRASLRRVQTPQGFRFDAILKAHRKWSGGPDASDDAAVLRANGQKVALVEGDERLKKVTFAEDFNNMGVAVRTGMGFDVHRLEEGRPLWLNGVKIPHDKGLGGHSDADVGLHALTDALLGAIGTGDIGDHFPPSDDRWKNASSDRFVHHACKLVSDAGYTIANVDITLICEAPKIGPHRHAMRERVADLLGIDVQHASIKATTTEGLGLTGRGEGIAAQAIATLLKEA